MIYGCDAFPLCATGAGMPVLVGQMDQGSQGWHHHCRTNHPAAGHGREDLEGSREKEPLEKALVQL